MIPRLWVCTDQPLPLVVGAIPLHPVAILALVIIGAWWMLIRRGRSGVVALRIAAACAGVLCALTLLFCGMAAAFGASGLNATPVLSFAPVGWALAGVAMLVGAAVYVRSLRRAASLSEEAAFATTVVGWRGAAIWVGILGVSIAAVLALGGRWMIGNDTPYSIPYRLFEWGVVDEIDFSVSDECLTMRALEYGRSDRIGRDAMAALNRRDRSAVGGVAAKMEDLRQNWPPPRRTVTIDGIAWALKFLDRRDEEEVVGSWKQIKYWNDLEGAEPLIVQGLW